MWKPNLTLTIKKLKLAFAVKYKDQTIEDQKRVIWMDETSVILRQQRGSHRIQTIPLKREDIIKITAKNTAIKPKVRFEWELSTAANQLHLDNNVPGRKP